MMLAINTAFLTANLALQTEDGRTCFKDIDAKSKHSENVLKTIDEMCQELDVDILDLDVVAVVTGPGSFTGLRIGTAVSKALGCVKKQLKFISLSSLEFMAYIIGKRKLVRGNFVCAINALSGLYFVGYFDENGIKLQEEEMLEREQFLNIDLPKFSLVGDLNEKTDGEIELSSKELLEFSNFKCQQNQFVSCQQMVPKYLRLSQAEDNLNKLKKDNKIS